MAVKVPEKILVGFPGVVSTSDTVIIDQSRRVLDLAGYILRRKTKLEFLIRLKRTGSSGAKR
jgi:hypothetical protein